MKAGIVQALFALEALQELQAAISKRIVFMWTSDEEIGSESSRILIEAEARRQDAVFRPRAFPRSSRPGKNFPQGRRRSQVIVHGRSSHAGLAPEEGINAVHELAAQIARIENGTITARGVTVNADVIEAVRASTSSPDTPRLILIFAPGVPADMRALEKTLHASETHPLAAPNSKSMAALIALRSNASKAPFSSLAPVRSPSKWASTLAKPRLAVLLTEISPRLSGFPLWMALALLVMAPTPRTSSCSLKPCRSAPLSLPLCWPLPD